MRPREVQRIDLELRVHTAAAWVYSSPSSSRPILMIHGFRGDHHGMDLIAKEITGHDVIVPDLPGFGASPALPAGASLDNYCLYLADLIRHVAEEWQSRPIIVGHSFGSILVAHTVARNPDLASELILINPITSPALEGPAKMTTGLTRAYYELGARLPERLGRGLLGHPVIVRMMSEVMATTRDPGLRRYIHHQHAQYFSTFSDRTSLAQAFEVSVSHTVTEVVAQLRLPLLVIAGGKDAIAPITATRAFAAKLTDVEFVEFPRVGHLVHYERPRETASAIMRFCLNRD